MISVGLNQVLVNFDVLINFSFGVSSNLLQQKSPTYDYHFRSGGGPGHPTIDHVTVE